MQSQIIKYFCTQCGYQLIPHGCCKWQCSNPECNQQYTKKQVADLVKIKLDKK